MKRSPEPETEGLLAGIRLLEKKIARKTFRGISADRGVKIKISGDLRPEAVEIDPKAFGISKAEGEAVSTAVEEALSRAVENAQRSASRMLEEELGQGD